MILGIDPKVDYAFKHLLGRDATRPLLMDVINNVLNPPPGHRLEEIFLLNPFNPKETTDDKLSILDIKARDQAGRQFNVEMQMIAFRHYEKRILYYCCKLHQQQLQEGDDYLVLKPTISISFLNHVLFPQAPDYHLCFRLLEKTRHFPLTGDMEYHLIELPKFTKTAAELKTGLDLWLYFLNHGETMDTDHLPAPILQNPVILRALEEIKVLAQNDHERELYEARRKAQLDYNTGLKVARIEGEQIGREQGEKFGREQGEKFGREQGEKIGREKGEKIGREQGEKIGREKGEKIGREKGEKIGREKGLVRGEKIGTIHLCESLLQRPQTPSERLATMPLEELTQMAEHLQSQVAKQS